MKLLTLKETAAVLRISVDKVKGLIANGKLPFVAHGDEGRRLVEESAIAEYVKQHTYKIVS